MAAFYAAALSRFLVLYATLYAAFPGMFNAFQADTTEVLAYGLCAAAVAALARRGRLSLLLGSALFGGKGEDHEEGAE